MSTAFNAVTDDELIRWVERCAIRRSEILASGYQGHVYFFNKNGQRLVIKAASGRGPMRWLRRRMLRNEFKVYSRLAGLHGCPRCYGLIGGRYLVLEYLEGQSLRHTEAEDRAKYYAELFSMIEALHCQGIAHFDLKRKNNLMVLPGSCPGIVDFGTAVIRKRGFAPVNHFLYNLAVKIDFNAWIKHKYRKRYEDVSDADRVYYRHTRAEKILRTTKRVCRVLRALFGDGQHRPATHRGPNGTHGCVVLRTDSLARHHGGGDGAMCDRLDAAKPAPPDF